jgi:hypothetical protein
LRENRRVVQEASRAEEIEAFHKVLTDISMGEDSNDVRKFIVDAYVRGWKAACAEEVEFEGSTAVFTKRRYRDRCRITKSHNNHHTQIILHIHQTFNIHSNPLRVFLIIFIFQVESHCGSPHRKETQPLDQD